MRVKIIFWVLRESFANINMDFQSHSVQKRYVVATCSNGHMAYFLTQLLYTAITVMEATTTRVAIKPISQPSAELLSQLNDLHQSHS
jgi:hypothetical protein